MKVPVQLGNLHLNACGSSIRHRLLIADPDFADVRFQNADRVGAQTVLSFIDDAPVGNPTQ